jgi:hypothetical protein
MAAFHLSYPVAGCVACSAAGGPVRRIDPGLVASTGTEYCRALAGNVEYSSRKRV